MLLLNKKGRRPFFIYIECVAIFHAMRGIISKKRVTLRLVVCIIVLR